MATHTSSHPEIVGLEKLIDLEREAIIKRRGHIYLESKFRHALVGLSLSGGGIRSACFNLGLLEGLDRISYEPPETSKLKIRSTSDGDYNHLELFDYVSSVSGGSYAAGHLATTMLPPSKVSPTSKTPAEAEWLGKVPLNSKTIPGWLWGMGVWFLGMAFQLLKTGSLLIAMLAALAFVMRTLDSPEAASFCDVLGLRSDIARGFLPFWFALGIFLVAYWINVTEREKQYTRAWFVYSLVVISFYVIIINVISIHNRDSKIEWPITFWGNYLSLVMLPAAVAAFCLRVVTVQGYKGIAAHFKAKAAKRVNTSTATNAATATNPTAATNAATASREAAEFRLRGALLFPILVALFCFAGLVTTGDIQFYSPDPHASKILELQAKSSKFTILTDGIYNAAMLALGLSAVPFLFPKKLFQSVRTIENQDKGKNDGLTSRLGAITHGPILRVIVFLSSYGFILLVMFVLYGMVAAENVSKYYEWREDLPSAAFHRTEFKESTLAWERIAKDDAAVSVHQVTSTAKVKPFKDWGKLAQKMQKARKAADYTLVQERELVSKIRALDAMPWPVRLVPPFMHLGPKQPWEKEHYKFGGPASTLYDLKLEQYRLETELARKVAETVMDQTDLFKDLPYYDGEQAGLAALPVPQADRSLWEKYLEKAKALEVLAGEAKNPSETLGLTAAIRNNNRRALRLYLGETLVRDREDKVIFASIVWWEDQWSRLWIMGIAAVLWVLCCAVDVNTFSLQKFYRGHVIDSWVNIPKGTHQSRWLHETTDKYRGHDYKKSPASQSKRRAPFLLINATLEGNRSLGNEPDLPENIFTFSCLASGAGNSKHCLNGEHPEVSLARRSRLDIGNIVTTSGAFLSPASIANPALSALLHVFNIQTAYWARDPLRFEERTPWESLRFHLSQSLGIDRDGDSRFMLTDGAHVENLGLYVLLQRRCSLIVASDCSQGDKDDEPQRRFDPLIQVLQQANLDGIKFGPLLNSADFKNWLETDHALKHEGSMDTAHEMVPSQFNRIMPPPPEDKNASTDWHAGLLAKKQEQPGRRFSRDHFLFSRITYPDNSEGLLVYLRPTLNGNEGDSLLHAEADFRFPDDDPVDQFYTPAKMNTYRLLGRHIAEELTRDDTMKAALARIVNGLPAVPSD